MCSAMVIIAIFIDPLPDARHCAKFFACITLFNLVNNPTEGYYYHLHFIDKEQALERLYNLSKFTLLGNMGTWIVTEAALSRTVNA